MLDIHVFKDKTIGEKMKKSAEFEHIMQEEVNLKGKFLLSTINFAAIGDFGEWFCKLEYPEDTKYWHCLTNTCAYSWFKAASGNANAVVLIDFKHRTFHMSHNTDLRYLAELSTVVHRKDDLNGLVKDMQKFGFQQIKDFNYFVMTCGN